MPLSPADLSTLSRLLDEALDLEPVRLEAWLAALPDEHGHLLPRLRAMLAEHLAHGSAGFMSDGPKLDELSSPADESVAHAGDVVGPYRLIREIGRGGMGAVWLAERADGSLKREIALKLPRLAWGAGLAERMARERDIGALLEHPHIARLYDAGVDNLGRPYLALEYIDGQPLDTWCEVQALGVPERLRLFQQVARAVAYAHGRLVVHRDLKPSNVLVTPDGEAHLLDFGIAKLLHEAVPGDAQLTQEQGRVLTPHYASPEQIRGEAITVQSDVYSLGVLLYELLTRQLPYAPERKTLAALEEAILQDEPPLASSRTQDKARTKELRGEIDSILAKALRREPGQRYATADALAEDIERHLNGQTVLAQPDSLSYRMTKSIRRHRVGFAAGGAVMLAILAGAGVSVVQAKRANAEAEHARVVKEFVVDVFKINERGDAANNELRQLPAELLLERGARLIETKFAGQPTMQAELFGVVGGIFTDMYANELALQYVTKQLEALAVIGAESDATARALILQAQALTNMERLGTAEERLRRAVVLAKGFEAIELDARLLLATVLFKQKRYRDSETELATVEAAVGQRGEVPSLRESRALYLRYRLLATHSQQLEIALPFCERAIESAERADGPLSLLAADYRLSYMHGLIVVAGREDDARRQLAAALATFRAVGGTQDIRAVLAEAEATSRMANHQDDAGLPLVSYAEAGATLERIRSDVNARASRVPEFIRMRINYALGYLYTRWGDLKRAAPLLEPAAQALMDSEDLGRRLDAAVDLGRLKMFRGEHARADSLLREALTPETLAWAGGDPTYVVQFVDVATNLRYQRRFDEAQSVLDSAPVFEATGSSEFDAYATFVTRAKAAVALERGQPRTALDLLQHDQPSTDCGLQGGGGPIHGRALCAAGRPREGLPLMENYISVAGQCKYVHDPWVARLRAEAGLCALSVGQRSRAAELGRLAHEAFEAQPVVSPYYKLPLQELDRRLQKG